MMEFGTVTQVGKSIFLWVNLAPSQGQGPSVPKKFWDPYICPKGLTYSHEIWYGNQSRCEANSFTHSTMNANVQSVCGTVANIAVANLFSFFQ